MTIAGKQALRDLRAQQDRAIRAPRDREVAFAFAFLGAAALTGTPHAAYASMLRTTGGSDNGGSGCSSGGDGGGGCGGCSG